MPWIKDENGDDKYIVSKYTKDELPTWNEIHEEFLKHKWYTFNPADPEQQIEDPFHKRPHRLVVLEFMRNQLNKMLTEDGLMNPAIEFMKTNANFDQISDNIETMNVEEVKKLIQCTVSIGCELIEISDDNFHNQAYHNGVFSYNLPIGFKYLEFRLMLDIDDETKTLLFPQHTEDLLTVMISIKPLNSEDSSFQRLLNFLLKDVIDYYKEPIGFKDKDGFLIDGYNDPAQRSKHPDTAL